MNDARTVEQILMSIDDSVRLIGAGMFGGLILMGVMLLVLLSRRNER